jgi:membrane protease YdiL (CAAX protease family)
VVPREYHDFFRTPAYRAWQPWAALGTGVVGFFVGAMAVTVLFVVVGMFLGEPDFLETLMTGRTTPTDFLLNNLLIILFIPVSVGAAALVSRQRPGWLASVVGRFRWRLFGRFLLTATPFILGLFLVELLVEGVPELSWNANTVPMIFIILLTTPLQCAGEEYLDRGLLLRAVGSMFGSSRVGFVVATVVSSVEFAVMHGAADVWLNITYFGFGVASCVLVRLTGGLEASIALHVANNMVAMMLLPFMDMGSIFDREAGTGSPLALVQLLAVAGAAFVIVWQAKRLSLPRQTAPGLTSPAYLPPVLAPTPPNVGQYR